jgi:hypothetical protein
MGSSSYHTVNKSNQILSWLLEDDNPAIKYRTLTEIYESSTSDELNQLYNSIWEDKLIEKMLKKQDENGLWNEKEYGSFTSLRYLTAFAEFGLHKDKRIDHYVDHAIDTISSIMSQDATGCAIPLVLRALVMLEYHERDDVKKLIEQFVSTQPYDGGFMCKRLLDKKPERKSCYKASVDALLLYAECKRKGMFLSGTDQLLQYFMKRDVFYDSNKTILLNESRPGWRNIDNFFPAEPLRIGLPLIVSALSILEIGNHPAVSKAWNYLSEKSDENGRLVLEGTLTKQPCSFGKVGQPNKWVSFYALLAYKYRIK